MKILKYKFYIILFVCTFSQAINASPEIDGSGNSVVHSIGSSGNGNEILTLIDGTTRTVFDLANVTDWRFLYDDTNGTGSFNILANSTEVGDIDISSAILSTNADGSLHANGFVRTVGGSVLTYFSGDIAVETEADFVNDVTLFSFNSLDRQAIRLNGLQVFFSHQVIGTDEFIAAANSVFVGGLADPLLADYINDILYNDPFSGDIQTVSFQFNSSVLAAVDSAFPVYSPVPLPAAFWLFFSGLIGLIAIGKRKSHMMYVID